MKTWAVILALVVAACAMAETYGPDALDARAKPDPIVIDTVLPAVAEITVGQPLQLCWFGGFKSGRYAMRTQDAPRCDAAYRAAFDSTQRAVSKQEQQAANAAEITWSAVLDQVT
jgi:hypothetical protein